MASRLHNFSLLICSRVKEDIVSQDTAKYSGYIKYPNESIATLAQKHLASLPKCHQEATCLLKRISYTAVNAPSNTEEKFSWGTVGDGEEEEQFVRVLCPFFVDVVKRAGRSLRSWILVISEDKKTGKEYFHHIRLHKGTKELIARKYEVRGPRYKERND